MALEERAIRGVPWTALSYGASKVITLLTTLVLARLLVPGDFGLVALAFVVINGIGLFRDLGLGGALVLRQDLDERAQGTILSLMVGMGLVLAVVVVALAPLAADLFREPRLTEVLRALSPTLALGGFNWFYESFFQRELEFRKRFAVLTAMSATYAIVAITLAALGAGVWSMVVGLLAGWAAQTILSALLTPRFIRPTLDRQAARETVGAGSGFMAQGGLAFLQQNADYLAVGRVLGAAPVGVYSMAYRLAEIPYWGIVDPIAKVTFPAFSRMRHRGEDVIPSFLTTLRMVSLVSFPLGVLLSACADPFTRAVLGDNWLAMIGPLSVLGIWSSIRTAQGTTGWLLNSLGHAHLMAIAAAVVLVPLIPGLFVAANLGGITAVAWVMLADMILSAIVLSALTARRTEANVARQWRAVRAATVAAVLCWGSARGTAELLASTPAVVDLVAAGVVGTATYLLAVRVVEPGLLRHAVSQAARTLGRAQSDANVHDSVAEELGTGVERTSGP